MKIDLRIHPLPQIIKSVLGHAEKSGPGFRYAADELLVLNYHSTPKKFAADFEKQVQFFTKHFNVIGPAELEQFYSGNKWNKNKCSVLFTFDDGLKNNENAITILDKFNIKAFFFVVPDFINTSANLQKAYYLQHIRPVINSAIDHEPEDFTALSWKDLLDLIAAGHAIGSHTQTHTLIAADSDNKNSEAEIIASKKNVEEQIGKRVLSFCSINNTALSVGRKEKEMIAKNYNYHFTTFPGLNAKNKNPLFIKRRNVECFWPMGAVYYAIGKMDLKRWESKIQQYEGL